MYDLDQKFVEYHNAHPEMYRAYYRFAKEAKDAGHSIGAKMLAERIRWETMVNAGGKPFKVQNSFVSYYARLLMWKRPMFRSLFKLHRSSVDRNADPQDISTWDSSYWSQCN